MSEIHTVYNTSSQQLLNLANTLKQNVNLQDKVLQSLMTTHTTKRVKKKIVNQRFKKHPDHLSSEPDVLTDEIKNNCFENALKLNLNEICDISTTQSDSSLLSNHFKATTARTNVYSHRKIIMETKSTEKGISRNGQVNREKYFEEKFKSNKSRSCDQRNDYDQKFHGLLRKILSFVKEIRILIESKFDQPDGDEDFEKKRQHGIGFCTRFGSNYVYQLERQMCDFKQITNAGKTCKSINKKINQQLLNNYNIILQALHLYHCHMRKTLPNIAIDKLKTVLEHTCTLCEIHINCANINHTSSTRHLIESVLNVSRDMISISLGIMSNITRAEKVTDLPTKLILLGYKTDVKIPKKVKPVPKKDVLKSRLSMYSISSGVRIKDAFWKRTIETLARDKLKYNHVQSRYKTDGYKRFKPPIEKPTVIELPTKSKLFDKRSSCMLKNTPLETPINEDEIVTMVKLQADKENIDDINTAMPAVQTSSNTNQDISNDTQLNHLAPYIHDLCEQVQANDEMEVSQKQLEILVKSILGIALDGRINNNDKESGSKTNGFISTQNTENLAETLQNKQQTIHSLEDGQKLLKELIEQCVQDNLKSTKNRNDMIQNATNLRRLLTVTENINTDAANNHCHAVINDINKTDDAKKSNGSDNKKNKRRQTVTVTGAKNAQLICIRNEDSIIEEPQEDLKHANNDSEKGNKQKTDNQMNLKKNDSSTASDEVMKNREKTKLKSNVLKLSRLPKRNLKQMTLIPKANARNIIQYKIDFYQYCKGNSLYQKKSKVPPWVFVDEVSDEILNKFLLQIAKEIQVNKLLEELYQSEFQH